MANQVSFTDTEYDQLANLLSILILNLHQGVLEIARYQLETHIEESLRKQMEVAADFRERIERR